MASTALVRSSYLSGNRSPTAALAEIRRRAEGMLVAARKVREKGESGNGRAIEVIDLT